jgi:Flp pilus assembly protein TadD
MDKNDLDRNNNSLHPIPPEARNDYGALIQRHAYLQQFLNSHNQKFHAALPLLRLLQTGQSQFEARQLEACQETLRELLNASPTNPSALRLFEACKHAMDERRRQEDQRAKLRAALSLAHQAVAAGQFRNALAEVRRALELDPSHQEAAELGESIRQQERLKMEAVTRRAAELLETCRARFRAKKFDAALEASRELQQLTAAYEQNEVQIQ